MVQTEYYSERIPLSLQTDLNVKDLHMALGKSWLPDYWALNRNLSVSLVNGLYCV